jgi:hypothetical protein
MTSPALPTASISRSNATRRSTPDRHRRVAGKIEAVEKFSVVKLSDPKV